MQRTGNDNCLSPFIPIFLFTKIASIVVLEKFNIQDTSRHNPWQMIIQL
jgi:hypothetical protein